MTGDERPTTVLCAVRGPEESAVVTTLSAPGAGVVVTRRCADLTELLAAAGAGVGAVAVLSADLPALDREAVARLHAAGVRVVALAGDDAPAEHLWALGVDSVLRGAGSPDLLAAVRDDSPVPRPAAPEPAGPVRRGSVVAVWGPAGSPGRTTTALNLAVELAARSTVPAGGRRRPVRARPGTDPVLLVDADTVAASVAPRLGLLDESAGLAAVCRAAGQGALDLHTLALHSPVVVPGLRVLTGIARSARWPELAPSSLEVVWDLARSLAAWTVVDCGPSLERDEALVYDTYAPVRHGATLSALAAADVVVVVGAADPVGVPRLVRGLEELAEVPGTLGVPRVVVANRVRSGVAGPHPEDAVRDALARFAGVTDPHLVPDDAVALDRALREGQALAEAAPGSPARTALVALADHVRALTAALTAAGEEGAGAAHRADAPVAVGAGGS